MKPLPEEILADVRWTLDNVVRPTLSDHFASEQAGLASNLLEHVRLRLLLEAELLRADCDDLRETLRVPGVPAGLRAAADRVPVAVSAPIQDLRDEDEALSAVLEECVRHLESAAAQGDEDADAALVSIRWLLRRQLDRERQMLGPGYAAGT